MMASSARLFAWLLFMSVCWRHFWYWSMPSWSTTSPSPTSPATPIPSFRCGIAWRRPGAAHEGSLLLWVLLMSGWTFAVAMFSQRIPLDIVARVLAIMGMVSVGFPAVHSRLPPTRSARTLPNFPIEGRDLNPLLQDPGLIFHPPLLYMGYVGFSVAFAFAIAALLCGRLDSTLRAFFASVDAGGVGASDAGHCARFGLGLLRAGLGRLVVLGSG